MDIYSFTFKYLKTCKDRQVRELAERSGVPYTTILKIRRGQTKNPGVLTVQAILSAIQAES